VFSNLKISIMFVIGMGWAMPSTDINSDINQRIKTVQNKCSAVAEMGDRLATIHKGRKLEGCVPVGRGSWVPM